MLNMLRMDIRRMSRARMFYIGLISLIAVILLTIIMIYVITDPESRRKAVDAGATITGTEEDYNSILGLTDLEALTSTVYSGGFFFVAVYIVMALFVCADYKSGFAKNIFAYQGKRWSYYAGKLFCGIAVCAAWLAGTYVFFKLITAVFGMHFALASAREYLIFFAANLAVGTGFCAQAIFASVVTRSEGAGVGLGIVMGGGLAALLAETVLNTFGSSFMDRTLYGCSQGIVGYLVNNTPLAGYMMVAVIWIFIWSALSIVVLKKRDI